MTVTVLQKVPRRTRRPRGARRTAVGWLFLAPFTVVFLVYTAIPTVAALGFSLTDLRGADLRHPFAVDFTGLDNYLRLFQDQSFLRDILNTAVFVAVGVPLTMGIGLALALALNSGIRRLRGVFRTVFFAPVVTNVVAVALIWQYAFNAGGTVNKTLGAVGFAGPNWLDDPNLTMPVVILLGVWRNFGIAMVLFLAGLQAIPQNVYEAASLDGAGRWRQLRHITLPLLRPTTLMVSVLLTVFYLQVFDEPYLLTNGGPLGSTESVALYTYHQFGAGEFGMSSAASFVTLVLVMLVSAVQFRLLRPRT
ncbi:carbohydrate ABC transporter permease [Streptomyces phaeochromogenes]|uniref:Sugar ABC transporter permease n=1 Tax=Streptomyces phaeochromogenes TaxID=1923 RepID=A0ABZ1H0Z7_STRPH|nr:sugar ABC transporter permease [Streptomyces phaeochromogenes]MCX5602654.1 sugar ABC transporter permease [Streptomyces phaeochromogenes]WSD12142.1 sugar ABC transporter permease [Streptomyces phaeochromogenes]WSJ11055.1 sugar ABC transporter permease [Streptomyces phaeochromogenes]WSS90810.1 sugar ABC transporter permease [Streptomyces phaeochromogenes]WTA01657.1 sugar ABC transporter permease [Streptomyces phaeochromogenes]